MSPQDDFHAEPYIPSEFEWQLPIKNCDEIQIAHFANKKFPVKYHVVKIDLASPRLEFCLFPKDIECDSYFKSRRTKTIAKEENLHVAINLSPFENVPNFFGFKSFWYSTKKIIGLHKVDSKILSSPLEEYCALAIKKVPDSDGNVFYKFRIFGSQLNPSIKKYPDAVGGFFVILHKGEKKSFKVATHDTRIAVGFDEGCRYMYILAVEGEYQNQSMGLSYPECADIFIKLGCTEAMQMDGGASSQLMVNGKSYIPAPYTPIQANTLGIRILE